MPRKPRVFVECGIYHVYNRFASGEPVFADSNEAVEFVELLRSVKERDGWTVFAWVLMSNHYHLAVRSSVVPISRGFHALQGRFSQRFNRRHRRTGALWQSRYQARPINEQGYLDRVILYIHLNPVAGGLVERPEEYRFGGHREIVRNLANPLVDADDCLLSFGQRKKQARKGYLAAIRQGCRELGKVPVPVDGRRELLAQRDLNLDPDDTGPYLDPSERSPGPERPNLAADEFVARCASVLEVEVNGLASRSRQKAIVESRRLIVTLGRERWNQRTKDLASAFKKSPDTVTYIQREGTRQRLEDDAFRMEFERLDRQMTMGEE